MIGNPLLVLIIMNDVDDGPAAGVLVWWELRAWAGGEFDYSTRPPMGDDDDVDDDDDDDHDDDDHDHDDDDDDVHDDDGPVAGVLVWWELRAWGNGEFDYSTRPPMADDDDEGWER
jgi:cbb3-type cytochrome oxidase subunit 3